MKEITKNDLSSSDFISDISFAILLSHKSSIAILVFAVPSAVNNNELKEADHLFTRKYKSFEVLKPKILQNPLFPK